MIVGEVAAPLGLRIYIVSVPIVIQGDDVGTSETYDPSRGVESLSGSPSSLIIWSRTVCAWRGGLADDDGGWCRWAGGSGGGVGNLLLVRDDTCSFRLCVVEVGPGGPLCLRGAPCVSVVSVSRKA